MTEIELREQVILDAGVTNDPLWQGSRITNMLNQAQRWLQVKLIKQGFKNWKIITTGVNLGNNSYQNQSVSTGDLPSRLSEMPIEWILPATGATKPAKEVENINFYEVVTNGVLTPTDYAPIFVIEGESFHIFPQSGASDAILSYTEIVTELVFDDNITDSEIPLENQNILVERVVMQIKSIQGDENVKQAKFAEIDKELSTRYQLDQLKTEGQDKQVTQ